MSAIFAIHPLRWNLSSEAGISAPGVQEKSRQPYGRHHANAAPGRIRILPGVASLHSVSKPIGPGGGGLFLTSRSQPFRSRNLRQIRRFLLPLMSLNLRSQPMRISRSQSQSAEMRRCEKTREWSLMYPCLRLRNWASNKPTQETSATEQTGLYPVATIDERRIAGVIDAGCLALRLWRLPHTLWFVLAEQFTFSKLSAAVCVTTFIIVYLAIFCALHDFRRHYTGHDAPSPSGRQLFRRIPHAQANALAQCGLHAFRRHFFYGVSVDYVGRRCSYLARPLVTHISLPGTNLCRHRRHSPCS